jgi:hypothetical protein
MDNGKHSRQHRAGKLNVILHGALVYQREQPNQITAWIPKLDHHVYRAGNWLAETDLQPGHYLLEGVDPAETGAFDPMRNLILKPPQPNKPDESLVYANLIFPWPKKITSLRVAKIPEDFFKHSDELAVECNPQFAATLQILTYDFEDDTRLKLADATLKPSCGHYWEPVLIDGYINLHIFAAEDHFEQPSLAVEDFKTCAEMFGYKIRLPRPVPVSGVDHTEPPDGVAEEETEDLAPRTLRMGLLGRLVKQNGDANQAWFGDDALDGVPGGCWDLVC